MRLILASALIVLATARIRLPTYWTGAFWPEKTTTTTTPAPTSPRSMLISQTDGNLVKAMEFLNKSSALPPTVPTTTSTTPIPDEDNHFLWRERQEKRMTDLFRGNPHHDNRMEMVLARRKAREESGVMKPGYVDGADDPTTKKYTEATLHHPVQYVFVQVEGIQRRRAEYEKALKEIEEEELIEADFINWQRENDARNERRRVYLEMKRQKEILEKYPPRKVKIEEDDHELDGYYEEMHMPHPLYLYEEMHMPHPLYLSVKNLYRRKPPSTTRTTPTIPSTTRDPTDGMPASFMCC